VADVFVLAVISSLDAGLIAAAVVLLGRPRPASQLRAYLVGGMGFSIAFGVVILLALHGSGALRRPSGPTSAIVEVAAGVLLMTVAVIAFSGHAVQWHPRRRTADHGRRPRQSLQERALGHDSLWIAWAAGALYSAPAPYYLAGLALLAKLGQPAPINVVAIVAFNVIMFAFIELPLIGFLVAPEKTRKLAQQLNHWMTRHKRTLVGVAAGAAGTYLLVSGLSGLL
jgi:hypothetical protein